MSLNRFRKEYRGQIQLDTVTGSQAITTSYTKLASATFTDGCGYFYETISDGKMSFTDTDKHCAGMNGSSGFQTDSAGKVIYALFKNGVLVPKAETEETVVSASRIGNISITVNIDVEEDDYFDIYVKASVNMNLTLSSFNFTSREIR